MSRFSGFLKWVLDYNDNPFDKLALRVVVATASWTGLAVVWGLLFMLEPALLAKAPIWWIASTGSIGVIAITYSVEAIRLRRWLVANWMATDEEQDATSLD